MEQTCIFCGHTINLVHVHGHYQCPVCHTNALPCCDGDNCETNQFLQQLPPEIADNPPVPLFRPLNWPFSSGSAD